MKRLRYLYFLMIALFTLPLLSCGGKGDIKYFRKARLNGRYDIVGRYQIDRKTAENAYCYRFHYDDQDRPVRVEYLYRLQPKLDRTFGAAAIEIEYGEEIETRRYLGGKDQPIFNYLGVYIEKFELNEDGHRVARHNFSKDEQPMPDRNNVFSYIWEVDKAGRRIKATSLDGNGKPIISPNGIAAIHVKYDDQGRMSEQSYHDSTGNLVADRSDVALIRFKYNERNEVIEQNYLTLAPDGEKVPRYTIYGEWNENGYSTLNRRVDADGSHVFTYKLRYDQSGMALTQEYYDQGDTLVSTTYWDYKPDGSVAKITVKDKEGNIIRENTKGGETR